MCLGNLSNDLNHTGQLLVAKGELEQAYEVFKIVLDGQPDNVPALLGQVCPP
jgi:RNA polymerase-associated protein CTR9